MKTNKDILDEIDRKLRVVLDYAADNGVLVKSAGVSGHIQTMAGGIKITKHTVEYERVSGGQV